MKDKLLKLIAAVKKLTPYQDEWLDDIEYDVNNNSLKTEKAVSMLRGYVRGLEAANSISPDDRYDYEQLAEGMGF